MKTKSKDSDLVISARIAERVLKVGPDKLDLSSLPAKMLNETLELLENASASIDLARRIVLASYSVSR